MDNVGVVMSNLLKVQGKCHVLAEKLAEKKTDDAKRRLVFSFHILMSEAVRLDLICV